jgi:hypothetical protein
MKSRILSFAADALALVLALVVSVHCFAQGQKPLDEPDDPPPSEIELLKRRVTELEKQNAEMLRLLQALDAKLGARTEVPVTSEASATLHQPGSSASAMPAANPAPVPPASVAEPVKWNELTSHASKLKFYGFVRLDVLADSQRPNSPAAPLFILSPDAAGNRVGAKNLLLTARFTRLGLDFTGPRVAKLGDAKLSGRYEMDFFGNFGPESRANARIRFAWLKLDWEHAAVTIGQDWQILSPLLPIPNQHADMFAVGNVGDRRPLIKTEWKQKAGGGKLLLQGGIGLTGATDAEDLDNDGFRDGETSGRPHIEGRLAYIHALWVKDKPATFGFGGLYGWEKTIRPIAGVTEFHPQLLALDYVMPLTELFEWRGEAWWGRHLTDFRGGVAQSVNTVTGREIRARGGWTELRLTPSEFYSLHGGVSVDDPLDQDLGVGGRTRNRAGFVGARFNASHNLMIGLDYLRWLTDYKGQRPGQNNRVNLIFQYSF